MLVRRFHGLDWAGTCREKEQTGTLPFAIRSDNACQVRKGKRDTSVEAGSGAIVAILSARRYCMVMSGPENRILLAEKGYRRAGLPDWRRRACWYYVFLRSSGLSTTCASSSSDPALAIYEACAVACRVGLIFCPSTSGSLKRTDCFIMKKTGESLFIRHIHRF